MFSTRMIVLVISLVACLIAQTACNVQYPNVDENTNCPLNVNHVCKDACAEDQNRLGCYCELDTGDALITASIFTPCPADILDPCSNNTCLNGATCVRNGLTGYTCTCAPGFGGSMCETTLPKCADGTVQCLNGKCIDTTDPITPIVCQCYDGTRRDPRQNNTCPPNPCYEIDTEIPVCQNNGTCQIINNAHVCDCRGGYAGQNCTRLLRTPLCENSPGVCGVGRCQQSLTPPYYSCNCGIYPSTFGKLITDLTKCEASGCYTANPCLNGGTCSNKALGGFVCQCSSRFTGTKCEKPSLCFNNPCLNQGICTSFNDTTYFCDCPARYTGQRCESLKPDPCLGRNCGPYGVCRESQGSGFCFCDDGLHLDGSTCQNPCLNRTCGPGVCTRNISAPYQAICSCPIDRKGDFCELSRDVCRQGARCGGGYCKPNYALARGYSCVCEGGMVKPDPCPFSRTCPISDCGTQGICVETDGIVIGGARPIYYVCLCSDGYISSGSCDLIPAKVAAVASQCGPQGTTYPSRNPNNEVGCWCNNGTHVEEIKADAVQPYCL